MMEMLRALQHKINGMRQNKMIGGASMLVSPSLLAADFSALAAEIERIPNADMLHVDVMDGVFVPNISIGPGVIQAIRGKTAMPFDVHLMIQRPLQYIETFASSGADSITFHPECGDDPAKVVDAILACGKKAGFAIKPKTAAQTVFSQAERLYMVTIMSVEPGFGGQEMMVHTLEKIQVIKKHFPHILVEVDGGVNRETAILCKNAGADILVSGTAIFAAADPVSEISFLKNI